MSIDITTIGVALDTSGLEKGARAFKDAEQSANRAADAASKVGTASTGVAASYGTVRAAVDKLTAEETKYLQKLVDEYKQLSSNRGQMEAYRAAQSGMSKGAQELAAAVGSKIEAYKRERQEMDKVSSAMGEMKRMAAGLLAGVTVGAFLGKIVAVQREFDVLNSSLKTVTGSSAAAGREMEWIKDFAKATPFGLAQATQGFVKMKALGLDPTRAALTSFGNTASAMGKDLNQMIEAVADASTGEFERLKEFGIKARKQGDDVSLTFQGVTTKIGNSAAEIKQYLEDIGNTKFAGAMEERAKTLDGTIAALGDSWDELFRTVSANNVGGLIFDSVTLANGALEDATTLLRAMGGAAQDASRDTGALSTIQNGIATVFETVAVLGANLKYVLVQIGNEIGGLAAQVAQAAQFNFSGVAAIRSQMVADAEAARKEIDATTERILNARKAQEEYARWATRNASAATDPRRVDLGGVGKPTAPTAKGGKGIDAANKELEAQAKLLAELSGLSGTFAADWARLNALYAKGELSLDGLTEAQGKLLAKQPAISAAIKEEEEARKLALKTAQATADARNKEIDGINAWLAAQEQAAAQALASVTDRVRSLADEEEAARMAAAMNISLAEAVELVTIARLKEKRAGFIDGSKAAEAIEKEIEARGRLLDQLGGKNIREREERGWTDMWNSVDRTAHDVFVNVLQGGQDAFKRLGNTLKASVLDVLYQMTVRKWIISIGTSVFGAGFGLAANAATGVGAGGVLSTAGSIGSGFSLLGGLGTFGGGLSAGFGGLMGTLGLSSTGATLGGAMSAGGIAMGAGNIMGGIGTIMGALGPIALGISLLGSLFGRKLKDSGIEGTFGGESGFEGRSYKFYKGGLLSSDKTTYDALDEQVRKSLGDTFKAMQAQVSGFADALGLTTDRLTGYTSTIKLSLHGLSDADAQKKIQEAMATANNELAQQVIGTWTDVTETVKRQVASTAMEMEAGADAYRQVEETITRSTYKASEFAREGEKAIDTLTRLATSLTLANTWFARFGATLFDASLGGGDKASSFIDAAGGADAFNQQASSYFNNFYTSNQRRGAMRSEIEDKLDKAGVAMPQTAAEFRAAMDAFLAMGEAGKDGAAALFGVADAFAEVNGSVGDLEQAMGVSAQSLKGILDDVRKGAATPADASKRFEDSIYEGLGSAMTQGLSQMIMSAVVGPLVDSLLTGATGSAAAMAAGGVAGGTGAAAGGAAAGGAVAAGGAAAGSAMAQGGAMAGAAVASTIEQARAYMAGFAAIMNDPAVRDTIREIADGFGSIAGDMAGITGGFQSAGTAMNYASSAAGSMGDSISSMGDAIEEEVKRLRGLMVGDSTKEGRDVLLADFTTATAQARAGDQSALERLPELSQRLEAATQLTAGSSVELARMRGWLAGSLEETKRGFQAQTDAQHRAAMYNMGQVDLRDEPRYLNTWDANPVYTPWEEGTIDSRYANSWTTTPNAGTGNLRGQDPNAVPDYRYTGGGIGAGQYDARDPAYMEDWRYRDTWSADPYLRNPRPSWYGRSYEIGTNYVPSDGLAYLHEGEAVVPKAYNPAAKSGGQGDMAQELRAMRAELAAMRAELAAQALDAQRLRLRGVKVQERWETGGMPPARTEGAYT